MKKCPLHEFCGGCDYQGIPYPQQLKMKQERVNSLLSEFGKVSSIIACEDPYNYRNKAQFSFGYDEKGKIISGYYMSGSHRIVPVDECMLVNEGINKIYSSVKRIIISNHISVYDERRSKGCLRHVLIRSTSLGEYMVVLVTASAFLMKKEKIVNDILKYNPEVKTIVHNINEGKTSAVLGKRNIILYGKGYITDELCGMRFRISPSSFYQVNRIQTSILYEKAIEAAEMNKYDTLIDAYCGTGTITLSASGYVKKAIGVETNHFAVKDAEINKKINDAGNCEFVCEDAGRYMDLLAKRKTHIDIVIMDPPRGGSDERFLSSVMKMGPEKIIYISCNPVTLKRDLHVLKKHYDISLIQPVDMFPFTEHVETVCCLYHQKKDFISVPYEPKDADYLKQLK